MNNQSWIVARTGHNERFNGTKGRLYVHVLTRDETQQYQISAPKELFVENGATYAQLAQINDSIYLLSRDVDDGWGYFISNDKGATWSIVRTNVVF